MGPVHEVLVGGYTSRAEQSSWQGETDPERLTRAFAALPARTSPVAAAAAGPRSAMRP